MNEGPPVAIIFHGEQIKKAPKATIFDWIKYYIYNIVRKPMVYTKQKELLKLSEELKSSVNSEVLDDLDLECVDCRNAFMALKPQIFLSQIEAILRRMKCAEHPETYENFLRKNQEKFMKSEKISSWINGFSK